MAVDEINPAQLTEEKNLFQLYMLTYSFPTSRFNVISTFIVGACCVSYLFWVRPGGGEAGILLKEILKFGISLVPSILGFLIAGFTVFVTVTKPGVFSAMAKKEYAKSGQSYLKYNLSAFMLAFSHYVAYLGLCVLLVYFGQPNGPLTQIAKWLSSLAACNISVSYNALVSACAVAFACWTWYLVMLLKSFIYNVYQVVVTSVRWDLEDEVKLKPGSNSLD
jgi:hypothetical protein